MSIVTGSSSHSRENRGRAVIEVNDQSISPASVTTLPSVIYPDELFEYAGFDFSEVFADGTG